MYATTFEQYYRELCAIISIEYGISEIYCSKKEPFIRVYNCVSAIMSEIGLYHIESGTENGRKDKIPINKAFIKHSNEFLRPCQHPRHLICSMMVNFFTIYAFRGGDGPKTYLDQFYEGVVDTVPTTFYRPGLDKNHQMTPGRTSKKYANKDRKSAHIESGWSIEKLLAIRKKRGPLKEEEKDTEEKETGEKKEKKVKVVRERLFLQIKKRWDKSETWFTKRPMGLKQFNIELDWLTNELKKIGKIPMDNKYVLHSFRAGCASIMKNGGSDNDSIRDKTGHLNDSGLEPYIHFNGEKILEETELILEGKEPNKRAKIDLLKDDTSYVFGASSVFTNCSFQITNNK